MTTNSHVLVDANIARSCADPARHETSESCLRLIRLLEGKACGVGVALTPILEEEWRKHATRTFVSWWAAMESRKRIRRESDRRVGDYRRALEEVEDAGVADAMAKDAFLVEAAILHGFHVASQDERQRRYIAALSSEYALLSGVQWFNPVIDSEWEEWIAGGCEGPKKFPVGGGQFSPEIADGT
ncbi:hypothetical protein ACFVTZ_17340 [Cellulosimicrobium cellulans]|uniref:hypothetical protein n=1 Tax=Cellulosimicrobium cellulans TaxID=1710 RepID=UPI0036EF5902